MKKLVTLMVLVCSCVAGFAQFGFNSSKSADDDAREVCKTHKVIAILPFQTNFDQKSISGKAGKKEQAKFDKDAYGLECQKHTYNYFLKLKEKRDVEIEIQPVEVTNAKMAAKGYTIDSLLAMPYADMCAFLGVDGAIKGYLDLDKYMSKGGAWAMQAFAGGGPSDEQIDLSLSIIDGKTGNQIWYFENTVEGSLFSKADKLVDAMMYNIGRKLPYFKKK
jgi:hypothetical protein